MNDTELPHEIQNILNGFFERAFWYISSVTVKSLQWIRAFHHITLRAIQCGTNKYYAWFGGQNEFLSINQKWLNITHLPCTLGEHKAVKCS